MPHNPTRNFVVIAHIDHGKSTLADRFLEATHTVEARNMKPQLLDQMDLERERGITIKMQPVRMLWTPKHAEVPISKSQFPNKLQIPKEENFKHLEIETWNLEIPDSKQYILNLIDTPGHIDFSYEVSRALAAVEGAILLVDATQGVQAQTITNLHIDQKEQITIIPAVNKIDSADARVEETVRELAELLGCEEEHVARVSARTGAGVPELLGRVVREVPPPDVSRVEPAALRALIFDSTFEAHRGVIAYVRVVSGAVSAGMRAYLFAAGAPFEIKEVGVFSPSLVKADMLSAGDIGYIVTGVKQPARVRIGDTVCSLDSFKRQTVTPLPGYVHPQPVIWASFYPEDEQEYEALRDALSRLQLNDAALQFEPESSPVLGRSFACGFLGMLHLEIVTERLQREFSLSVITTSPSIAYEITQKDGTVEVVSSAAKFPPGDRILRMREPWMAAEIIVPDRHLGDILTLIDAYEGVVLATEPFGGSDAHTRAGDVRMKVLGEMPLREIVSDFFDKLKSVTAGYASLAYEPAGLRDANVERIDIHVAEEPVAALSRVVSRLKAHTIGRSIVKRLKDVLPRQLFQVKIQAVIGGRVVASESLAALKKNVTGHLYGGDRTRKMKLWKKQKAGKKRLKAEGKMRIPPEAFLSVLKNS